MEPVRQSSAVSLGRPLFISKWVWVSMKPGKTSFPAASTTWESPAGRLGPIWVILPPSMRRSAWTGPSGSTRVPFWMRIDIGMTSFSV